MINGLPNSTPTLMKLRTETNPLVDDSFPLLKRKKSSRAARSRLRRYEKSSGT